MPILISSYKHQRRVIEPAVAVVLAALTNSKQENVSPKLLLHTFSNGGTNTAAQLLIVAKAQLGSPIPFSGLVFDSCPAKGTYWKSYDAMILSLPKSPVSTFLGPLMVHGILILLYSWIYYGNENPASLQRRIMLDEQTVGIGSKQIAAESHTISEGQQMVYYIYSKADKMCDWRDIRDHADEARQAGYHVEEFIFEGSAHCAHLFKDPMRYGGTIKSVWEGSAPSKDCTPSKL